MFQPKLTVSRWLRWHDLTLIILCSCITHRQCWTGPASLHLSPPREVPDRGWTQLFVPPAHHRDTAKHLHEEHTSYTSPPCLLHSVWSRSSQDDLPVCSYFAQDISTVASRSTCNTSDNQTRNSPKITDLRSQQTTRLWAKQSTETSTQKFIWTHLICEIWCSFLSLRSSDCRRNRV